MFDEGPVRRRAGIALTAVTTFAILVWIGSGSARMWHLVSAGTSVPSLGDGVVSGVFVAGAACATMVTWRRHAGPRTGWIVATGTLIAGQALLVALLALQGAPPRGPVDQGLLIGAAAAGLLVVIGPLLGLHHVRHVVDDGFAIGLGMGLLAAGHLLLQFPVARPAVGPMEVLIGVLVATHVAAVLLVARQGELSRPMTVLMAVSVLVVGAGQLVNTADDASPLVVTLVSLSRAAVGAVWLTLAWVSIRRALEEDRRRIATFEHVLVSATRDQRERLHELRSTLAGLVTGSELMESPDVSPEQRERLWGSVRRELARMERLVSDQDDTATEIELDDALGLILDLQRLKGRRVEFRSNGDAVRARFDALAEVVNVLMDNAVKHGGTDASLVEVVRRDEENVDIRVTDYGRGIPRHQRTGIFGWGTSGSSSPGEGIGLHVASRLMTEDGGSLRLDEDDSKVGSSFVITLPRARRSLENDDVMGDARAWRRSG
jgi:signal transduction histidine kinase